MAVDAKIYPFKTWSLLGPAAIFWLGSTILSLAAYGSPDPAAAKVGSIALSLDLVFLILLLAAALFYKPHLSVTEQGIVVSLPFRTFTYAWNGVSDVTLGEAARQPVIKVQLKSGATKAIPLGLVDPMAAYASIRHCRESAQPAA